MHSTLIITSSWGEAGQAHLPNYFVGCPGRQVKVVCMAYVVYMFVFCMCLCCLYVCMLCMFLCCTCECVCFLVLCFSHWLQSTVQMSCTPTSPSLFGSWCLSSATPSLYMSFPPYNLEPFRCRARMGPPPAGGTQLYWKHRVRSCPSVVAGLPSSS